MAPGKLNSLFYSNPRHRMVHRTTELEKRDLDDWPDRAGWVTDFTHGISGLLGHGDRPRVPRYQRGRSVDCRPSSDVRE